MLYLIHNLDQNLTLFSPKKDMVAKLNTPETTVVSSIGVQSMVETPLGAKAPLEARSFVF